VAMLSLQKLASIPLKNFEVRRAVIAEKAKKIVVKKAANMKWAGKGSERLPGAPNGLGARRSLKDPVHCRLQVLICQQPLSVYKHPDNL